MWRDVGAPLVKTQVSLSRIGIIQELSKDYSGPLFGVHCKPCITVGVFVGAFVVIKANDDIVVAVVCLLFATRPVSWCVRQR